MKRCNTLLVILLLCVISCQTKDVNHKKLLTLKDLKFPLVDDENGEVSFPNPYKRNLVDNHIFARVRIPVVNDMNSYPTPIIERYKSETKNKRIKFSQWAVNTLGLSDTSYYDWNANLLKNVQHCGWCPSKRYEYDSDGYNIYNNSGSDAIMDFTHRYYFDSINSTLYYATYINHANIPSTINIYKFDSLGYLICSFLGDNELCSKDTFIYNNDRQISIIETTIKTRNESKYYRDWVPGSYSIPTHMVCRYFYYAHTLDSIVTKQRYRDQNVFDCRTTYYDSTGLAIKTIKNNNYINKPVVVEYSYIHRETH